MDIPTRRTITSRSEFHAALRSAFAQAAMAGAREIWLCDADFADWPLGDSGIIDDLTHWAHAQGRLNLLAQTFDEIARRHGRWTQWRRQWAHRVECRTNGELDAGPMPTICLVPGVISVRLMDPVHYRGIASHEPADAIACREVIDAVLQRSVEAFPVTTLGL